MKEILTAVFDDDYIMIFGMETDNLPFFIECENEPKAYAKLVFNSALKEHLDTEAKVYNDLIASMSEAVMENQIHSAFNRRCWRI